MARDRKTKTKGSGRAPRSRNPTPRSARVSHRKARVPRLVRRLAPRKTPRQDRARETVGAILMAAAEMFANQGYPGATTNKIAERAGVSIGSLYQYFPNKDAILAGLMEQHLKGVRSVIEQSLAELEDPSTGIEQGIRSLFVRLTELHGADPTLTKALSEQVSHLPPLEQFHRKGEETYTLRVEQVLAARPEVRSGDHFLMAHIVVQISERLTRWMVHDAPHSLDSQAAIDEAVRLVTRYLQA